MLGNLTNIVDTTFVVRCFLPSLILVIGSIFINDMFTGANNFMTLISDSPSRVEALAGSAFIGLVAWVLGIVIAAIQREIVRTLEGYGRFNPLKKISLFTNIQVGEFRKLQKRRVELNHLIDILEITDKTKKSKEFENIYAELTKVALKLSTGFPSSESSVLPTSFGNAMRALEGYSTTLYGLDSIPGYTRLQGVIPSNYQTIIDEQRMYRDFWVNIFMITILLLCELMFFLTTKRFNPLAALGILPFLLLVCVTSYVSATSAAIGFGEYIKSAFDLYIDSLGEKLGIPKVEDPNLQRSIWLDATRAFLYIQKESLDRAKYGYRTLN